MVSYLRSCYRTKMRFYSDRPDVLTEVQWFFVEDGTEWIGYPNTFDSRNWYLGSDTAWPMLGEVEGAPRTWVNGASPGGLLPRSCQTDPSVWVSGVPFSDAGTSPATPRGVLFCCLGEPPMAVFDIRCDDGSLNFTPSTGHVEGHLVPSHRNTWTAMQVFQANGLGKRLVVTNRADAVPPDVLSTMVDIDASADPAMSAFNIIGDVGHGPVSIFEVFGTGHAYFRWQLYIGGAFASNNGHLTIGVREYRGLVIQSHATPLFLLDPLVISPTGDDADRLFAITKEGHIVSSQAEVATTTGAITNRLPIYDASGTLIGYIPIYDDL